MKKITYLSSALFVLALLLASCQFSVNKTVAGKGSIKSVDVEDFARVVSGGGVQLVDVRTADEHNQGAILGSLNIDVNSEDFGSSSDSLLDKEKPVAIYCRSGRRSKKAAEVLSMMGFDVVELDKGYNGWVEAGKKVMNF